MVAIIAAIAILITFEVTTGYRYCKESLRHSSE